VGRLGLSALGLVSLGSEWYLKNPNVCSKSKEKSAQRAVHYLASSNYSLM